MKKNTVEMMYAFLNGQTVDVDALKADVTAEYERLTAKSNEKAQTYAVAHDVVMRALTHEMTVKEIYETCADDLPDDFTSNKIQYAFRNYWADEVEVHDNGKNPKTYSRKA